MIHNIVGFMQKFGWDTKSFSTMKRRKKKRQKLRGDELNNILNPLIYKEPSGSILWGTLDVNVGMHYHMIAIYDDWIFDSNHQKALPRTKKSLDLCIDVTGKGYKFNSFITLYVFRPKFV